MRRLSLFVIVFVVAFPSLPNAQENNWACDNLFIGYRNSQASLEALRTMSNKDFNKNLAGKYNESVLYANDLIPRIEWQINHITELYIANQCDAERLAKFYIDKILAK